MMIPVLWADYWKSQDRKYCDFCKCWLSDNKASIEFHEKGKKHKENVAKRLKTITKKSIQERKKADKMDEAIAKMEQAGMEAYQKDVESSAADLMAKTIKETLIKHNLLLSDNSEASSSKKRTPWYETKTLDGKIYYWNTETNQSIWDEPPDGFITMEEQLILREKEGLEQLKTIEKQRKLEAKQKLEEERLLQEEQRAAAERERLKLLRPKEEPPEPTYFAPIIPEGKNDPYGKWQTIKTEKEVDLQLPKQEFIAIHVPAATKEPVTREFKEKTISKLDKGDNDDSFDPKSTLFKKRKILGTNKRNMRQRLDDD